MGRRWLATVRAPEVPREDKYAWFAQCTAVHDSQGWSGQPTGMESELHVLTASQQRILQQLGLRRQPTPSDGACQFHAVSTAVDEDAMAVRGNAIAYIRQHPADFEDFVEGSLEEYLIRMSDPCQWGDHVTLIAIAEHYKRPVRVISDREDADFQVDPVRSYPASSDTPICVLFYAELHYEATVQDTSSALRPASS